MKLGCSSSSYSHALRDGRLDLHGFAGTCAEMDLDGVEFLDLHFPTTDPLYLRDLKRHCTELQLTVAGIAVSNDFGPAATRATQVQNVQRWCDVAAYLGAPVVRVYAGWAAADASSDGGRIAGLLRKVFTSPAAEHRRAWSDITWALRQCADYAADRGIVLGLQNGRDGLVAGPQQLWQCVRDVGSPWLKVCMEPAGLAGRARLDLSLPATVQCHARLREVREDGSDSTAHWPEILRVLKLNSYRGFVLLDYEGAEDAATAVSRAARHMRGLMHLLARQQLLGDVSTNGHDDGAAPYEIVRDAHTIAAEALRAR